MKIFRAIVLTIATLAVQSASALKPGSPSISMSFEIEDNTGKVVGSLTAPVKDSNWQELPEGTRMTVTVSRSCYNLSESEVAIATFNDLAPGQQVQFTDNATPAWQYGYEYTYTPVAYIGIERNDYSYGSSIIPGLPFSFGYQSFKVTPAVDGESVELSVVVPSELNNKQPLPVPIKAIEFYRGIDYDDLVGKIENPESGSTVSLTDNTPRKNTTTIYMARAVTDFGSAQTTERCYVGFDVPYAPYPVSAESYQGGIRVFWTAPDRGANWGAIDPAETVYNVFRCWGSGENNRELIAEGIKETEFVDYGTDMLFPRAVRYQVQSANNIGLGEANYSSYDYSLIIGPEYSLPFVESFDGGSDKMWVYTNSSYYARMYISDEADYGNDIIVKPHSGSGLIYVNYSEFRAPSGSTNTMTSYKVDLSDTSMPALSYWYYAIPGNDIYIDVQLSTDGTDFSSISKTLISLGADSPGWKKVILPLSDFAGESTIYVRFVTGFTDKSSSAIIDDIILADYLSVGAVDTESDPDNRTITLTWTDPGSEYTPCTGFVGYVDGESIGNVSSPWVFEAPEYDTTYSFSIEALYDGVKVAASQEVTASVAAPEVTEFTSNDYIFTIDKGSAEPTVWIKAYTGNRTILSLPERVSYGDVSYVVTEVLDAAFKGNETITSVVIPATCTTLGEEAFAGCVKLLGVTIGAGVTEIRARAFAGCTALSQVIFMSLVPPVVADDAFAGIAEGCKGTAPDGKAETYAAVDALRAIDFGVSGITEIEIESAAKTEFFDLNGRSLTAPVRGGCTIVRITGYDGSVRTGKITLK